MSESKNQSQVEEAPPMADGVKPSEGEASEDINAKKRSRESDGNQDSDDGVTESSEAKKQKGNSGEAETSAGNTNDGEGDDEASVKNEDSADGERLKREDDDGPAPVPASTVGTTVYEDADVLSGRGGGTNVHPGNRMFRDLINLHRRAYLKARKNDKPAISRAIVRTVREANGRFLKKDEKAGLWYEIGDDAAREKTSQALRQRAPEMRKLLFDTEREEARAAAEEHLRQQQRMYMGMPPGADLMQQNNGMPGSMPPMNMPPQGNHQMFAPNPAFLAMAQKNGMQMPNNQDPYSHMFSAALMGGGMNRYPQQNSSV